MAQTLSHRKLQLRISERRLLLMFGDAMMIVISVFISLRIWASVGQIDFDYDFLLQQSFWFFLLVCLWFALAGANDFYNLTVTSRISASFLRLLQINLQLLVVYLIIFFFSSRVTLPRLFILYHAAISFVLIGGWRLWRPFLLGWPGSRRRALIIGTGWAAETILQTLAQEASNDYEVMGCIGDVNSVNRSVKDKKVLGTGLDLPTIVKNEQIAELILAYGSEFPGDIFQGIMSCYELGIDIVPMPILYEQITGRVPIEHVGQQHWTVVLPIEGRSILFNMYRAIKRLFDIVFSLIGLVVFIAMLPLLALAMTLDCPGPIFFKQDRVGRGGKIFTVYKLRSMIPNAEQYSGPKWAASNDPRITRVGRLLRKARLDELPQLVNILKGEMSLIGPRPERPVFVDQLTKEIPFYRTRLAVNPGLTGWAQVCYHYGNTTQDALVKLQYDLYYIRHQSLTLDLLIMLRTAGKMLALQGT